MLFSIWYWNIVCFIVNNISFTNLKPTQISVSLTFKSDGPIIFWIKVSWNRLFTEDWTIGLISRYIYDFFFLKFSWLRLKSFISSRRYPVKVALQQRVLKHQQASSKQHKQAKWKNDYIEQMKKYFHLTVYFCYNERIFL